MFADLKLSVSYSTVLLEKYDEYNPSPTREIHVIVGGDVSGQLAEVE